MAFRELLEIRSIKIALQSVVLGALMWGYYSLLAPASHWRSSIEGRQRAEIRVNKEQTAKKEAERKASKYADAESFAWRELAELEADRAAWLKTAANEGDVVRMQQLIDEGTDVNAQDEQGVTALISAASALQHEAAALLLSHGADPSKLTKQGFSAYDFAHNQNDEELAHALAT